MHSKLLWCLSLAGLFAAFTLQVAAQQTPGKITAVRVTGPVGSVTMTVKATNATTAVSNNSIIEQGSTVKTARGASVILAFNNGATVNLGTESELDIEQFLQSPFDNAVQAATATDEPSTSTTKLKLTRGELVGKVAHLKTNQGSTFTIATPVGAAGIRGTTFRIVYRPDGTGKAFFSLTTLEGNVEITLATGTVTPPISVTNDKEVVLADVTVTVNTQTGQVTITTAAGTSVVPTNALLTSTQAIVEAAQQIAQAVAAVVITPPAPTPTPPPSQPPPTTTSGAGL